jgi:hypothetical protein
MLKLLVLGTLLVGCSDGDGPSASGTGGSSATGGSAGTGGTGGSTNTGGSSSGSGGGATNTGGSSSADASTGATGGGAGATDTEAGTTAPDTGTSTGEGTPPYGCTGCKRLFDGKTLTGWDTAPGAWVVKEGGVLASTGVAADIYTHEDLGDYRIFFQVKHLPAMGGKDHQPCITMFGKRPADPTAPARALGGAQFQPPNGYHWDYGVGGTFTNPPNKPKLDAMVWNQCEIVVKEAGEFHAACCTVTDTPCKTFEVLSWKGTGRKHPFDFMMHNGGLFDEYREVWIEISPTEAGYLSQK